MEQPSHWPAFIPPIKECVGQWTAGCWDGDSSDVSGCSLWQTLANKCRMPSPVPEPAGLCGRGWSAAGVGARKRVCRLVALRGALRQGICSGKGQTQCLQTAVGIWQLDPVGAEPML